MQTFNKAVVFTDSHFGRSSDSPVANQDNLDFIDWMIDRARSWGAETCIFMGDYFHNRSSIGVSSLHAALAGLETLSKAFPKIIVLKGNHDIFRRATRDISSLNFAKHLPNIEVIANPVSFDDVTFLPWLVEDEMHTLPAIKSRYVFAHLETAGAIMNARTKCSGPHAIEADTFKQQDYVFTGHFHQRQHLRNICYIGSIMPFDFSDANDDQRGAMFLQWGKEPFFEAWPDQPLYRTTTLSQLLDDLSFLKPKMTLRTTIDVDLRYEEAQQLRDTLVEEFGLRKIELIKPAISEQEFSDAVSELHTVDQIVVDGLMSIQNAGVSAERLVAIFNGLPRP
jgi:DNA repair exonuclease SbcCD nuclease subunit